MKRSYIIVIASVIALASCSGDVTPVEKKDGLQVSSASKKKISPKYKEGDIIFQATNSPQCKAIQQATGSEWSHCGLLFYRNNKWQVLEAVQPVQFIDLDDFIDRGQKNKYVIKRLKDNPPSEAQANSMEVRGEELVGKNYDIYFNWDDERIYCSELVYKLYDEILSTKVGEIKKLKDYKLDSDLVRGIMKQRYGDNIPWDEPMIAPGAIFNSTLLLEVESN